MEPMRAGYATTKDNLFNRRQAGFAEILNRAFSVREQSNLLATCEESARSVWSASDLPTLSITGRAHEFKTAGKPDALHTLRAKCCRPVFIAFLRLK
jgi:hypothetical protein